DWLNQHDWRKPSPEKFDLRVRLVAQKPDASGLSSSAHLGRPDLRFPDVADRARKALEAFLSDGPCAPGVPQTWPGGSSALVSASCLYL
ncbi:hypothetical protein, partial [Streptosporangium roseum]|uniref:hypothetical protein n=1 Tax=Streptosporangium roseum TaxID=2001 RepID=UPI00331C262A